MRDRTNNLHMSLAIGQDTHLHAASPLARARGPGLRTETSHCRRTAALERHSRGRLDRPPLRRRGLPAAPAMSARGARPGHR